MDDKFCYMPWHGLAIAANGNIKPCCQWIDNIGNVDNDDIVRSFKNSNKIIKLREQFLNGEKPISCESCWTRESQIGDSRRIWFNKFVSTVKEGYVYQTELDDIQWTQMDINLSNVCNLKCRMCGSWASNSWFEEDILLSKINPAFKKEGNPERQKIRQHELESLKSLIPYLDGLTRIDFKGGEPMMAKNHVEFLKLLIDNKLNEKIILQYTTNGTIVNPNILNTLSNFKKIRIMFSIEGTGNLYGYIRGGKYSIEDLESVISMYNDLPNVEIGFNVTVQAYNLLDLKNLYDLLKQWSSKYKNVSSNYAFTTICNSPMYLSPFVLPKEIRVEAEKKLKGIDDFTTLLSNIKSDVIYKKHWETFKDFTQNLDRIRSENVLTVIPELKEYWHD